MAHDVFISYASEDKTIADAVCAGLEKEGVRCWIAPRDILPSDNYDDAIVNAIASARVMVVIFSSNIFQSQFVKSEVERAFSKGLIIAPFRIENVNPTGGLELYLGRRHWLDAINPPLEAHIHTLAVTICSMLKVQKEAQKNVDATTTAPQTAQPPLGATEFDGKYLEKRKLSSRMIFGLVTGGIVLGLLLVGIFGTLLVKNWIEKPDLGSSPTSVGMTTGAPPISTMESLPASQGELPSQVDLPASDQAVTPVSPGKEPFRIGGNWLKLEDLPRTINAFISDPTDPKVVYAATGDSSGAGAGIYKSEDSGITWHVLTTGLPVETVNTIAVLQQESGTVILASVGYEIYASSDGAASWTKVSSPSNQSLRSTERFVVSGDRKTIYALANFQGVARSENGGQSWIPLNNGLPEGDDDIRVAALALDPTDPLVMYAGLGSFAGQGQGVYKSSDGGETWTPSNKGMLDYGISTIAVDPQQPQTLYAGCDSGDLFKSTDGGQTWTNLKDRLKLSEYGEPRRIHTIQIDPSSGIIYLLGDNSGMLVSENGGEQWKLLGNPPGVDQPMFSAGIVLYDEKPVILVATYADIDTRGWRYSEDAVAISPTAQPTTVTTAPGKTISLSGTWQAVADLPRSINDLVVDPKNPQILYAGLGGSGGVYKSVDGGLTWNNSSSGLSGEVTALTISPGSPTRLFATVGYSNDLYVSADQANSWTLIGKAGLMSGFRSWLYPSPNDSEILYQVSDTGGLSRTSNGGQSWIGLMDGLPHEDMNALVQALAFDPSNSQVMYAGTGGFVGNGQGVFKSIDGGDTWMPSNRGMLDYRITALAVDPNQPQVLFAGSDQGDLFKSSDGGQSWLNLKDRLVLQQYGEPREIRSIQIDPSTGMIYLLGDNSGLLYSQDGGEKWRLLGNPPGTNQPRFNTMAIRFEDNPIFFMALMDEGGVWTLVTDSD